jgi:hypothetical protein
VPTRALLGAIDTGADMVGAVTGGAIGLIAPPFGPLVGAGAGVALSRAFRVVGNQVIERFSAPREATRVGGALAVAAQEIEERLVALEMLRQDGFFDAIRPDTGRTAAEEVLEGVLRHAADAYEEKKVRYLGAMYATAAFDASYTAPELHLLLKLFDRVTYRGLVLLAIVGTRGYGDRLRDAQVREIADGNLAIDPASEVIAEIDALAAENLIGVGQEDGSVANYASVMNGGTLKKFLEKARLTELGQRLYTACQLDLISTQEREELLVALAGRKT